MRRQPLKRLLCLACLAWSLVVFPGLAAPIATVTITTPTNGTVLSAPATFDLRASVAGGGNNVSQVEFLNGTNSLGVDSNNPFRHTVSNLPAGTYHLWAVLTDNLGGKSSNSVTLVVNALPLVSITNPADGSGLIAPATFALSADASDSDGSVAQVQFFLDTTVLGARTANPYSVTVKSLGVGSYAFTAVATDNLGGESATNIHLVVKNRPTVAFTAPAANARVTNGTAQIAGTAEDSFGVSVVECSLNSGPFLTADGTNNWSQSLSFPAGINVLRARSTDLFGNLSLTNTRSYFQVVASSLSLGISGTGVVSGATNGQILEVARGYQLTATAGVGYLFSNWTGSASSPSPKLGFLMQSNMALQANFVPDPFLRVNGTFTGLFYETNEVRSASSGDFRLRLSTSGKYSAALRLAGRRYTASGKFDLEGNATNTLPRSGMSPLGIVWALDLHGLDQITGSVSDGQWLAPLLGDRARFNASTNPAPLAARYTLVVPGLPGATDSPAGDGWGTLRVTSGGLGLLAASLADGTRVARKAPVSKTGSWPLYAPLYLSHGSVIGWVQFDTNGPLEDLGGRVDWSRPARPASIYYPGGFTNQTMMSGSRYLAPATSTNRVIAMTNGVLLLSGGNLSQVFTNDIVLGTNNRVTNASPNSLSVSVARATGLFKGSFLDPGTAHTVKFSGALLQKATNGAGFFLGTNLSGRVSIGP